jgi:hypothetical protein
MVINNMGEVHTAHVLSAKTQETKLYEKCVLDYVERIERKAGPQSTTEQFTKEQNAL